MMALGFAMALQFKPDGRGGYLYRRDQQGVGVPVTAAERDSYVRWYGWMVVTAFVLFFAGVIAMAVLFAQLNVSSDGLAGPLGAIVVGGGPLVLIYLFLRWTSYAPARAFAGRAADTRAN